MTRRQNLLSKFVLSLSLAAGVLAVTASASAQTQMRATVPFAFTAGNASMPAGHYSLTLKRDCFLYLTNTETGKTKILVVRQETGQINEGYTRLTFHSQPGGIYLAQLWTAGSDQHTELTSHPKPQRELAKLPQQDELVEVATK